MRISLRELMLVVAVAAIGLAGLRFASSGMLPIVQAMTGMLLLFFLVRAALDVGQSRAFAIGFVLCSAAYLGMVVLTIRDQHLANTYTGTSTTQSIDLNTPTGSFGTKNLLDWIYPRVASHAWWSSATGKLSADFRPTSQEILRETVVRIELEDVPQQDQSVRQSATGGADDIVDSAPAQRGGRGGRGRRSSGLPGAQMIVEQFSRQQTDEFVMLPASRQEEIIESWNDPQFQKAILSGRPLSSVRRVTYHRTSSPLQRDFEAVGYCLWSIIIGYAGGNLARFIYRRRRVGDPTIA
jgi:hypothetical protein